MVVAAPKSIPKIRNLLSWKSFHSQKVKFYCDILSSEKYPNAYIQARVFMLSRTKPGIHGPKPDRTRTTKKLKISDRTEPGPTKIWKSRTDSDRSVPGPGGPWIPDQNELWIEPENQNTARSFYFRQWACY